MRRTPFGAPDFQSMADDQLLVVLVKFLHIRHKLFAGTETVSLSVYKPIANTRFVGESPPPFRGGVELRGRLLYPVKVLHFYAQFVCRNRHSIYLRLRASCHASYVGVSLFGGGD